MIVSIFSVSSYNPLDQIPQIFEACTFCALCIGKVCHDRVEW